VEVQSEALSKRNDISYTVGVTRSRRVRKSSISRVAKSPDVKNKKKSFQKYSTPQKDLISTKRRSNSPDSSDDEDIQINNSNTEDSENKNEDGDEKNESSDEKNEICDDNTTNLVDKNEKKGVNDTQPVCSRTRSKYYVNQASKSLCTLYSEIGIPNY